MSHEIKLDVYTLKIKKSKNNYLGFDNFYKSGDDSLTFTNFFQDYIKSFDSKFWVQEKTNKAISIEESKAHFASDKKIIYGQFEGGTTGLGSKIKKRDNISDEMAFKVTTEDVDSIPYYFLLWLPSDSNLGLLIVQSFSSKSFSETLKWHLKNFFNQCTNNKLTLMVNEFIPSELEKEMKEKGVINTIILRRLKLPSTKAEKILGIKYIDDSPITVEVKFTGLSKVQAAQEKIKGMVEGKNTKVIEIDSLEEIGIDGHHDTVFTFEHNGKQASGKHSQNFKLSPSFYVDEKDIKRNLDNHVTFESIHDYTLSFLSQMKEEIGYKPVK